jgi:hypothetical protein
MLEADSKFGIRDSGFGVRGSVFEGLLVVAGITGAPVTV